MHPWGLPSCCFTHLHVAPFTNCTWNHFLPATKTPACSTKAPLLPMACYPSALPTQHTHSAEAVCLLGTLRSWRQRQQAHPKHQ
jgi:hypothetical protein